MTSLVGKWKLGEGSDLMPGLEFLPNGPLVLKLLGEVPAEFYKIEMKKTLDIEEIQFSYVAKNASVSKSFQLGTLNVEQISGSEVSLGIVQNVEENFRELTIFRMGPKAGQNSKETFKLEPNNDRIKLSIEVTLPENPNLKLVKYLVRYEEHISTNEIVFKNSPFSQGWKLFEDWQTTMLRDTKISIVKALKVKTLVPATNENTKVVESVWVRKNSSDDVNVDLSSISRHFGYYLSEGEEVVEFVIKVTVGDMSWFVTHRYREFDAIRKFILSQNPHSANFQDADSKFPGKVMGLSFRPNAMENRIEGLQQFLTFYLENATYCRYNSVLALFSFLKIPENISDAARVRAGKALPPPTQQVSHPVVLATIPESKPIVPIPKSAAAPATDVVPNPPAATNHAHVVAPPTAPQPTAASRVVPATAANKPAPVAQPAPVQSANATVSTAVTQTIVASNTRMQQVAKENLFAVLEHGLMVIKHGRQGAPKSRKLKCDAAVTKLFWHGDGGKDIMLADVTEITTGNDVDKKATSPAALAAYNAGESKPRELTRRMSSRKSILGGSMPVDENAVLFGTENLRRHCKEENMHLCISLILPDRTLDLQCLSEADYDLLLNNLKVLVPTKK